MLPTDDDAVFRDKMLGHEFSFDPKAWEDMEQLLDQKSDKPAALPLPATPLNRIMPWATGFGVLLFIAGAILLWMLRDNTSTPIPMNGAPIAADEATSPANPAPLASANAAEALISNEMKAQQQSHTPSNTINQNVPSPTNTISTTFKHQNTQGESAQSNANQGPFAPEAVSIAAIKNDVGELNPPSTQQPNQDKLSPIGALHILLEVPRQIPDCKVNLAAYTSTPVVKVSPKWTFGWLVGAQWTFDDYSNIQTRIGPHLGFYAEKKLSNSWSLQTALMGKWVSGFDLAVSGTDTISQPNNLASPTIVNEGEIRVTDLLFAELPILLKKDLNRRWSVLAGVRPSLNFLRYTNSKFELANLASNNTKDLDFLDQSLKKTAEKGIRRMDLGFSIGLDFRINRHLQLAFRANQGMPNLISNNVYNNDVSQLWNSDLQLSLRGSF